MKYITERNSETGKKFAAIEKKLEKVHEAQSQVAEQFGFVEWRNGYWTVRGGFSAVIFPEGFVVDTKAWKNVNDSKDEWMPRLSCKEGKAIDKIFKEMPRVEIHELNECIGFKEHPFKTIGFAMGNKKYFGFVVGEDWKVKIPADCKEVTVSEYNNLFDKKKKSKKVAA